MNKLPNKRNFNYDMKKLLGIEPPPPGPPYSEVDMVISGLEEGDTWNGLGNGTHHLDMFETLTDKVHACVFSNTANDDYLVLVDNIAQSYNLDVAGTKRSGLSIFASSTRMGWKIVKGYWESSNIVHNTVTGSPSIQNSAFSTANNGAVNFTWSKGADWSRGNM